jgi:hypothetical protein
MLTLLWCTVLAFGPIAGGWLLTVAFARSRYGRRSGRLGLGRRGSSLNPPIETLGRDLHRLTIDYERTEHANEPGKANRLRATSIAYDDLLVVACCALDVPAPTRSGHELLDPIDRLTLEAELARAGLSW